MTLNKLIAGISCLLIATGLVPTTCFADVLIQLNGERLVGKVFEEGTDQVVFDLETLGGGSLCLAAGSANCNEIHLQLLSKRTRPRKTLAALSPLMPPGNLRVSARMEAWSGKWLRAPVTSTPVSRR